MNAFLVQVQLKNGDLKCGVYPDQDTVKQHLKPFKKLAQYISIIQLNEDILAYINDKFDYLKGLSDVGSD